MGLGEIGGVALDRAVHGQLDPADPQLPRLATMASKEAASTALYIGILFFTRYMSGQVTGEWNSAIYYWF